MNIIEMVEKALQDYTAYELAKVVGVSNQSLQKHKNGEAKIENMRLGTALEIVKYVEERINMKKYTVEELKTKTFELLESVDEEFHGSLFDVYYEPNNTIFPVRFESSGMAYDGDDQDAVEVFQIEDGEIVATHVSEYDLEKLYSRLGW